MGMITGRIFKPRRYLYYIHPTEKEIDDYYLGIIPEILKKYDDAYGTYDSPSMYRITKKGVSTILLGIEYRPEDKDITYPNDLDYMELRASFMVHGLSTESVLNRETIDETISQVHYTLKDSIFIGKLIHPRAHPEIIQISTENGHNRIIIEASRVTKEEFFTEYNIQTETEKELYDLAYREPITNHYNWNYIWPKIAGFGLLGIQDYQFVHFDVKDFGAINTVFSHDTGNKVLIRIANKMKQTEWIYYSARCHNDNFCMMIKDMPLEETRKKLFEFFDSISTLEEDDLYRIYYRVGVVPMKHTILLGDRVADSAKYVQRSSKKKYETEIIFFDQKMGDQLDWTNKVKAYLDTAIQNDEFIVYYQPKFDVKTEKIHGAEALVRWMYQGKVFLNPGRFVPILETGGLINKVDDVVLHKVCQNLKQWEKNGLPLHTISVNLSRVRLGKRNLVEYLTNIVDQYNVDHSLIEFELTESAAFLDGERIVQIIHDLKERGFKTSLDDCGTGYSSLAWLTLLPIDTVKIDKIFADGILKKANTNDCIVLNHLIKMTKELNLTCLVEGVEEHEQIDILKKYGCDIVQGFYYSKPVPVEEYEDLLKTKR